MLNQIQELGSSICEWDQARFVFFSDNVFSNLIYYSHFLPAIISLLFGILILINNHKQLINKVLFFVLVSFSVWTMFDMILWASERVDLIMFIWSSLIYIEPLIYVGCYYLFYLFAEGKDLSFRRKTLLFITLAPVLIWGPTALNLTGFDFTNCEREAIEGPLWYYTYALETGIIILIVITAMRLVFKTPSRNQKRQDILISSGIILFLLAFSFGNLIGSFSLDWTVAQYGLFGMPLFIVFLAYLVVKYQKFSTKIFGTQMLIGFLWVFIFSLLFIQDIVLVHIIVWITFALIVGFGVLLNISVSKEIKQRREIEQLADKLKKANKDLESANNEQTVLIHFITHQVKGFLTKSKFIFSLMKEGDYGELSETLKKAVEEGYNSDDKGVSMVQDILSASNLKKGTMTQQKVSLDFRKLVNDTFADHQKVAETKGLVLEKYIADEDYQLQADPLQLKQAIKNIFDNAIKYTPKGSIKVSLDKNKQGKIHFNIKDTGVGIDEDDKKNLFKEGGRGKNSVSINVESTGYGLFIVKKIIDAHGGRIWVESEGKDKGSAFFVEL